MIDVKSFSEQIKKIRKINVCLIGETIIDKYIYVDAIGRASKDPVISTRKIFEEKFAGGVLAIANHLSDFIQNIDLVTLIGEKNSQLRYIEESLSKNVKKKKFIWKGTETIEKTRFLDKTRLTKLFKYENTTGKIIPTSLEKNIIGFLEDKLGENDIIIVADYGHGFLTEKIRKIILDKSPYLSINVQTNSSNFGFNPISKYNSADFLSLNYKELQMFFQNNEYRKDDLLEKLIKNGKYKKILLTAGGEGVIYFDGEKKHKHTAFTTRPIDTVGAGDAVFSITSLLSYIGEDEVIPELASIIGAIAVRTIGNKEPITKEKIINFIEHEDELYGMEHI